MAILSAGDIEAIVASVASRLSEGPSEPVGGRSGDEATKDAERLIVALGTFATDDSIRAATAAYAPRGAAVAFDTLGRSFPAARQVVASAVEALATGARRCCLAGLSLFELEALADPKRGDPLAELMVEALGRGCRVSILADAPDGGAPRLSLLRGRLAERRDAAFAALADMGVEPATALADPTSPVSKDGSAAPARKAIRLIDSALIASTARGATIVAGSGSIVTPLARDEARDRGIRIERNGGPL